MFFCNFSLLFAQWVPVFCWTPAYGNTLASGTTEWTATQLEILINFGFKMTKFIQFQIEFYFTDIGLDLSIPQPSPPSYF